jgi:nitroreductase
MLSSFQTLLQRRRSIRNFLDKEVPQKTIMEIIEEACLAPSSGNGQPWNFIIIRDKELIRRLSDESKKNLLADIKRRPDSPSKKYEAILALEEFNVFYNAPCLILIAGPQSIYSVDVDCALVACYLMFAAAARNLGTCWVALGSHIRDNRLRAEIGLPDDYRIVAPIIIGYTSSIPPIPERKEPQILKIIP